MIIVPHITTSIWTTIIGNDSLILTDKMIEIMFMWHLELLTHNINYAEFIKTTGTTGFEVTVTREQEHSES